ncbi:hypothetical protein HMPREF0591_1658 [Mycobacterium parascrofulaceum ATCC BAA-614]|uniref:Uncharacterized protein n=1 Tax=Mycobacterium parascrofulaceum ATCC BAA-614 TaxID=525368 RepID=D5P664_9MYCO|nr:hypothetical protein HMPREF0591_1658 [Mycobacterium parascrofulaceum ATCC BAA-614]
MAVFLGDVATTSRRHLITATLDHPVTVRSHDQITGVRSHQVMARWRDRVMW